MLADTTLSPETTSVLQPVVRELPADLETPASAYLKLRGEGPSFLLESVEGGERVARYSFIGVAPRRIYTIRDGKLECAEDGRMRVTSAAGGRDPFHLLEAELRRMAVPPHEAAGLPRFLGGLVGYMGFETTRYFEPRLDGQMHRGTLPEACFLLADTIAAFDHVRRSIFLIALPFDGEAAANAKLDALERRLRAPLPAPRNGGPAPFLRGPAPSTEESASRLGEPAPLLGGFVSNVGRERFEEMVLQAKEFIAAGDAFQVLISQRLTRATHAAPFDIYRALRRLNPSPYMFFFDFGKQPDGEPFFLAGSSPEVFVRLDGDAASLRPIAGTSPRGATPAEDTAIAERLLADPKERAEHVMLVDLGRNDLGRVCRYGSISVPEYFTIERYSHVMHLVSEVQGTIRPGQTAFDLVRAAFPAGTMSGAPKVRAMEIIASLEPDARQVYSGAVGYFSFDGSMDMCLAIRTLVGQGGTVSVQAGGGIVADSDPAKEYQESLNKARAVMLAVEKAEEAANGGASPDAGQATAAIESPAVRPMFAGEEG